MHHSLYGLLQSRVVVHHFRILGYRLLRPGAIAQGPVFRQIWIDPNLVRTELPYDVLHRSQHVAPLSRGRFCRFRAVGFVEAGDWATRQRPYDPRGALLFDALDRRFNHSTPWEETSFIAEMRDRLRRGTPCWNGCRSEADLRARCARADRLIASIRRHGFRERGQPAVICIGPEGELIKAGNGQHRIMLGIIAGMRIPVLPVVRHRTWEEIRTGRAPDRERFRGHPDIIDRRGVGIASGPTDR